MTKFLNLLLKVIVIFLVSVLGAWLTRGLGGKLYVAIIKPEIIPPRLFLIGPDLVFSFLGFLIAYAFLASLLSFLFAGEKKWLVWIITILPLLAISIGTWKMFIWYFTMALIAWLLAQGILLIYKQVKK